MKTESPIKPNDVADAAPAFSDTVESFTDLVMNYSSRIEGSILEQYSKEATLQYLTFYRMIFEKSGQVTICSSIVISKDLCVKIYVEGGEITDSHIVPADGKIRHYTTLEKLLEAFLAYKSHSLRTSVSFRSNLALSIAAVEEIIRKRQLPSGEDSDLGVSNMSTIMDQLRQIQDSKNKFSPTTIINCFKIHQVSPEAYDYLRSRMYLPNPDDLSRDLMATAGYIPSSNAEEEDRSNDNESSDSEGEIQSHVCVAKK